MMKFGIISRRGQAEMILDCVGCCILLSKLILAEIDLLYGGKLHNSKEMLPKFGDYLNECVKVDDYGN